VSFVYSDPDERRCERLGHRKGCLYGVLIVTVEVLLVEQLIVVDNEERRRSARIEVVFEATVGTVARDGVDLGGVGIGGGQLIEAGSTSSSVVVQSLLSPHSNRADTLTCPLNGL
jgi:hypothetical protein